MPALVSDTSVLIDLERGSLLELVFQGDNPLAVPDLLYQIELLEGPGPYLQQLGLGVIALLPDEMAYAQAAYNASTGLSLPDCFAFSLARRENHVLLTGDAELRVTAEREGVRCHGVLWVLDQLVARDGSVARLACSGLEVISSNPRCRLPRDKVQARINAWRGA